MKALVIRATAMVSAILLLGGAGGCLARRTVTENGQVISEGYTVKRPIRDATRE